MAVYDHIGWNGLTDPIEVRYRDGQGTVSNRIIIPRRYYEGRNGFAYLVAYCQLRHEERTFRVDRILSWRPCDSSGRTEPAIRLRQNSPNSTTSEASSTFATSSSVPKKQPTSKKNRGVFLKRSMVAAAAFTIVRLVSGTLISDDEDISRKNFRAAAIIAKAQRVIRGNTSRAKPVSVASVSVSSGVSLTPAKSQSGTSFSETYRGIAIYHVRDSGSSRYTAPSIGVTKPNLSEIHYEVNSNELRKLTGISSNGLERAYRDADYDGNGHLSWAEIEKFQSSIWRKYSYIANNTALRPDEFMASSGGDCEDWALFTCGLLRYWGWNCLVGSFGPSDGGTGHALVLVRSLRKITGYGSIKIAEGVVIGGKSMRPGYYIPIDYQYVGTVSAALEKGWHLRNIYRPEEIYGWEM